MTRTEIDTILDIAYERAIMNKQKFETSKQQIVLDAAVDLLKHGVEKSLIARTLKEKLVNKETEISKTTLYRALGAPEFKEFKSESHAVRVRGRGRRASSHVGTISTPIAVTVSTNGEITGTTTEPEPEQPETERKTKTNPDDMMLIALQQSGARNGLINQLLDNLSGIDEGERREIMKKATKGAGHELVERCKDHIFDLVTKMPDMQLALALGLSQQLLSLLQEYEQRLHDKWIRKESRLDVV